MPVGGSTSVSNAVALVSYLATSGGYTVAEIATIVNVCPALLCPVYLEHRQKVSRTLSELMVWRERLRSTRPGHQRGLILDSRLGDSAIPPVSTGERSPWVQPCQLAGCAAPSAGICIERG